MTKDGLKKPNFWGSLTQASTVRVGNYEGEEVHVPFKAVLPMVEPTDVVLGGWDISGMNLAEAMERAAVLDFSLQQQLVPYMSSMVPLPGERQQWWEQAGTAICPLEFGLSRCTGPQTASLPSCCRHLRPRLHCC